MSNVRALVHTRSIAFMHYSLRKALRIRFLLVSRSTALPHSIASMRYGPRRPRVLAFSWSFAAPRFHVQMPQRTWPAVAFRARFLLFSRNTALHAAAQRAGSTRTAHWPGSVRQHSKCHARRAPSSPCPSGHTRAGSHARSKSSGAFGTSGVAHTVAFRGSMNQCPNPSIEGTSTSKLRLLAAAPHVKR